MVSRLNILFRQQHMKSVCVNTLILERYEYLTQGVSQYNNRSANKSQSEYFATSVIQQTPKKLKFWKTVLSYFKTPATPFQVFGSCLLKGILL